jgi:hypothetical protein
MKFSRFFRRKRLWLIVLLILIILLLLFCRCCYSYEEKSVPAPEPTPTASLTPTPTPDETPEIIFTETHLPPAMPSPTPSPTYLPIVTPTPTIDSGSGSGSRSHRSYVMKIQGPGNGIFNISDGLWWPGRILEKSIEVKNTGNLPLDFTISCSGNDKPFFDAKNDGANVGLNISWDDNLTLQQKWRLLPNQSQNIFIRIKMPELADNTCQGDIWSVTFTFAAVQIGD